MTPLTYRYLYIEPLIMSLSMPVEYFKPKSQNYSRRKTFNSELGGLAERVAAIYVDNVCLGRSLAQAQ